MAHYLILANFTEQGIKNIKDTIKRGHAFRDMAKSMGVTVKDEFWSMGQYDVVLTADASDDAMMAAVLCKVCSLGNAKTQTLRLFDEKEMTGILSKI